MYIQVYTGFPTGCFSWGGKKDACGAMPPRGCGGMLHYKILKFRCSDIASETLKISYYQVSILILGGGGGPSPCMKP